MAGPSGNGPPILLAYDGSDRAKAAIAAAADLLPDAKVIVLHVFELSRPVLPPAVFPAAVPEAGEREVTELVEEESKRATAVAEAGVALASSAGLAARAEAIPASGASGTWSTILEFAEKHDVALIVVGARGHSAVAAALLGSVSDGVVHHADRPVMVVPARARTPSG
jgi:nucleotide-binding universal stress UspA family protein